MKKGEIFEKFYTRSDKAINIGNLFLRASSVVYHNSAKEKTLGTRSRHWNFRPNIDSQTPSYKKCFFSISLAIFKKLHYWRLNFLRNTFLTLSNKYLYTITKAFWKWPNRKPNSVFESKQWVYQILSFSFDDNQVQIYNCCKCFKKERGGGGYNWHHIPDQYNT